MTGERCMIDTATCDICDKPCKENFTLRFIDGARYHHQCYYDLWHKFSLWQQIEFYIKIFIKTGKIWRAY
jgi:hypothetical protein